MTSKPSFRPYLLRTFLIFIAGWGGLAALLWYSLPTVWPRWSFFFLWTMALSATALPVIYFLTTRFSTVTVEPQVLVRQSLWVGIYGATLAWLQLAHLVNVYVILGLAFGLVALESLLRLRERARWRVPDVPEVDEDDQSA
jgi:hypothetical protein